MVVLSGGQFGGNEYDGTDWVIGQDIVLGGYIYRRIDDIQAVYIGTV